MNTTEGIKKKIMLTGISGVCKNEYLVPIFKTKSYSIEEMALTKTGENPIWRELDPKVRLEKINKAWEGARNNGVITFHCVWWTPAGFLYDQFNMADYIKTQIKPDYLITLINNITDTRWYLQCKSENGDKLASQIGLRDIIIWRANEINVSRLLAQYIWGKDFQDHFYVIATGHQENTIRDLVYTEKPRAYLAFPVRKFRENTDELNKIRTKFIPLVEKYCVVFNPYTIYEKEIEQLLANPNPERVPEVFTNEFLPSRNLFGEPFFPKDKKPSWFSLTIWEIAQVLRDINAQIVERDKLMVQQSDFVVAYRPLHSEGAQRELNWSIKFNRQAYALVPEDDQEGWQQKVNSLFGEEVKRITLVKDIVSLEQCLSKIKKRGKKY